MYLSSQKTNREAERKLRNAKSITSSYIARLSKWYELRIPDVNVTLKTMGSFVIYLENYRVKVLVKNVSLEENVEFYTNIDTAFLDLVANVISVPLHDRLLIALDALLRASDDIGIQRALGSSYWSPCEFPRSQPLWFLNLRSQANTYLDHTFRFHKPSLKTYTARLRALDPLEEMLDDESANMIDPAYASVCKNMTLQERFDRSGWWFDNMTMYMDKALGSVRAALIDDLLLRVRLSMEDAEEKVSWFN